jgi:nucleotide-binding universal stress UspA family protein
MKIVVGYDGSEHAQRALERAIGIAGGDDQILVVSAASTSTIARDPAGGTSSVDPIEAEAAEASLEKAKELLGATSIPARFIEGHGDPADTLVRIATDEGADLIVIGTRGLNFAQRALLGSVITKVVHHAHCDVLVVR